ncbi:putative chitin deacetylase [Spiroplasma clarkii]|uniref:polysaccharide deacetylase family protein n=1 Tax=Spiroplasma clarkii TaxID=2139 RepID=UPI000B568772|nr:polysaccharide deacetylase family protein [Spiroplasma clarkii]ARU91498.1 putative chitin deacetylase [Spiroplasma clarkii]
MKINRGKFLLNIFLMVVLLGCVSFIFATPKTKYEVNRIKTNQKIVMLTFDDGPGFEDEKILDILDQNNAKAIFFGIGKNYEKYWTDVKIKNIVDRMIMTGNSLGNHSFTHVNYHFNIKKAVDEFVRTDELIQKIYAEHGMKIQAADILVRMPYLQYYSGLDYLQKN